MRLPARYVPTGAPGWGGMSQATRCRDTNLDRDVIIKSLQDHTEQRRLVDEISALAQIRSKHVVQIYDVVRRQNGEVTGLVEEYLPGDDLTTLAPISDADVFMRTAYAIACGLSDIHAVNIIHRDIKPVNMKFDAEGCLKIFDFGLARSEGDAAATEGAVGTNGYMAPELCPVGWDETVTFSAAVDTYAFAATLLFLMLGSVPKDMRRRKPVVPPSANFSEQTLKLSPDVADILNQCLSPDPSQRPSAAEVRDLLGAHLLRNRHRAMLVANAQQHELHAGRKAVDVNLGTLGSFRISYDGLAFWIVQSSPNVYVNNVIATSPHRLPGACVITVGGPELGMGRIHFTVDISHPEVVL